MADVTYVISIRNDTGTEKGTNDNAASGNGGVAPTTSGENASGVTLTKKQSIALGLVAAKRIGNRVATTYISQVGVRTGNVTRQEQMNYTLGVVEKSVGIGLAIIGGAVAGSPLAVAAGVGAAISWGVDIAVAQAQLNLERSVENIGISQANIRAGAGGDRYGKAIF